MTRTMLNRLILVALAALVPCAILVAWAALTLQSGLPGAAQTSLDGYRRYRGTSHGELLEVRTIVRAWHPSEFTAAMSGDTYGDGVYFDVQHVYDAADSTRPALAATTGPVALPGSRPLPYPPTDAWCVVLGPPSSESTRVVVLALHEDTWVAAWVVHELAEPPGTAAFAAGMERLGCATPLGQRW